MISRSQLPTMVIGGLMMAAPLAAQAQLGRIELGRPLPDDRFPTLHDGKPASLADYQGKRVLLLVFASW